jgi:hypothetical protein
LLVLVMLIAFLNIGFLPKGTKGDAQCCLPPLGALYAFVLYSRMYMGRLLGKPPRVRNYRSRLTAAKRPNVSLALDGGEAPECVART